MKRVIITGATGAIGIALADILTQAGCEVYAVCRPGSKNISLLEKHKFLHVIECDASNLLSLSSKMAKGYDAFYHFAWSGTIGNGRNDPSAQLKNIQYTLDATLLAKELECKVFIGAGSQAEIGHFSTPGNDMTPTYPFTLYGAAKLSAGQMSRVYANNIGIKHIWGRIFSVYGPCDDVKTLISYVIDELSHGRSPATTKGEQIWDYLYSYDCAQAFIDMAIKGKNNSVYSVGRGDQRQICDYISEIRDIVAPGVPINFGTKEYSQNQVMFLSADTTKLKQDTGFVPKYSFSDGIREILAKKERVSL